MKLCLNCRQLSSDRDLSGPAIFCPHCGLSFGVKRCGKCKKKASSPLDATHCVHCGGTNLTGATAYLNFGWLTWILSLGLLWLFLCWMAPLLFGLLGALLGPLWRNSQRWLLVIVDHALFWILFFGVFSVFLSFLPKHIVEPWYQIFCSVLRVTAKGAGALVRLSWRGVTWFVQRLLNPRRGT